MENSKKQLKLYVLGVKDIQNLENINYKQALERIKEYDYFYINTRMYILASDYCFGDLNRAEKLYLTYFDEYGYDKTKVIEVTPRFYTAQDIQTMFSCGIHQSYDIIKQVPGHFSINTRLYVSSESFEKWLTKKANENDN